MKNFMVLVLVAFVGGAVGGALMPLGREAFAQATPPTGSGGSSANSVLLTGAQTIAGVKTFSSQDVHTAGITFNRTLEDTGASGFAPRLLSRGPNGAAFDMDTFTSHTSGYLFQFSNFGATQAQVAFDGAVISNSTRSKGTITLSAGTGNATTFTGARCACSDTTATAAVRCAVSGTTLTATGTGTDVIAYVCL